MKRPAFLCFKCDSPQGICALGTVISSSGGTTTIDMLYFTGVVKLDSNNTLRSNTFVELVLPPNVTSASGVALQQRNVEVIVIPGPTVIGSSTPYGTTKNKAWIFLSQTPPNSLFDDQSQSIYSAGRFYVPDSAYDAYKTLVYFSTRTIYTHSQLAIDYPDYYDRFVAHG